ncbi:MAG: DUF29 domain-containing protein [Cyanobacteria bacterium P01_H01_bin.105]
MENLYESDFYAWTQQQATLLRNQDLEKLDMVNLIDEIEEMGRREKRELESRLEVLLMHLLKWQFQPNLRSRSWELTIKEQRLRLAKLLKENPSLKAILSEYVVSAYALAIISAEKETGLDTFPEECPYQAEQVLNEEFMPK